MGTQTFSVDSRTNYKGGSKNSGGSQLIGWDNGKVRAEQYRFKTKEWPVTQISFTFNTSVHSGKNIAIRCGISTSKSSYTNSSGSSSGYAVNKNKTTTIKKSLKPNTYYYITFFPGVSKSNYGLLNSDGSWSIKATVTDRTACSAPTSITLEPVIQATGGTATLSWDGAKAGTNVPIASYDIYRAITSGGQFERLGGTSDAETTFYEVTAPTTSGAHYYYKVKTIASIAGYDSDLSEVTADLEANQPPDAPTITYVSRYTVPSTGGDVTFEVTAGTSYKEGVIPELYYSTSSSGEKIKFEASITVTVPATPATSTYYFYTYDGTDYSSPTTQDIAVNVKPSISSMSCSLTTYRALGGDGVGTYQLGYANVIAPTISTTETGKVTVNLEYYALPSEATEDLAWDDYGESVTIQSKKILESDITSTTNVTLNSCNIHQHINPWDGNTTVHWRISLILNDGIEDSETIYFPHNDGVYTPNDKYYSVAHAPSVLSKYNQFNTSDVVGTNSGQIYDKVRLKINYDGSLHHAFVSATSTVSGETKPLAASCILEDDETTPHVYHYVDITLPINIESEATVFIDVELKDSGDYITKKISAEVTETKAPSLSNALTHGAPTIKPFTQSGEFSISLGWPFGEYVTLEDALEAYNCDTDTDESIKLVYSSDNSDEGTNTAEKVLEWDRSSDNLATTMNRNAAYTFTVSPTPHELGYDVYAGQKTYYCRLEITNLFGKTYTTPWLDRVFNFDEPVVNVPGENEPIISEIEYSIDYDESDPDSATWNTFDADTQAIQEDVYLRFTCDFKLFTADNVNVLISVRSYGSTEVRTCISTDYGPTQLTRADSRTAASNEVKYIYKVPEIKDDKHRFWKLTITNTCGSESSDEEEVNVTKQTAPTINFSSCQVSKSYRIDYKFLVSNTGGGTTAYYLYDNDNEQNLYATSLGSGTGEFNSHVDLPTQTPPWESKNISIKTVSIVSGLITNKTKTYYSNIILAYQVTPTVAYRTNSIGINVINPDDTAMVDVRQATGKSLILVQGQNSNSQATKFVMNVSTGEIEYWINGVKQHSLNLASGQIT